MSSKQIVSLFAGAGGIDLGLIRAGHSVIWANDFDSDSCETYKQNLGDHIHCSDIKNVSSVSIPDSDLIVGGFPCQGFSVANKFRSVKDKRNELYEEMLRIIKDKQPKWFIAENVSGILSLGGGEVFRMIIEDFESAGYRVTYRLENMADFGVPQKRKRVLILGTRNDLPSQMDLFHPNPTHSKNSFEGLKPWVSLGEALREFSKFNVGHDVGSKYKFVERNFTGHRISDRDQPSPTILARGNGKGGVNATPHPFEERRLSVMESAYIQSFPPTYVFKGSMTSQYRQIGNAIPPAYGELIGKQLAKLGKAALIA
jgi:DNA (cytosine-5)-methyltransferase 1